LRGAPDEAKKNAATTVSRLTVRMASHYTHARAGQQCNARHLSQARGPAIVIYLTAWLRRWQMPCCGWWLLAFFWIVWFGVFAAWWCC